MRPPRLFGTFAAVLLVASGVACGPSRSTPERVLQRYLDQVRMDPHFFVYEDRTSEQSSRVTGAQQDGLRWSGSLSAGGRPAMDLVVSDDAVGVRVLDADLAPVRPERVSDEPVREAVTAGRWAVDFTAAPPLEAPTSAEGSIVVGKRPVLDAVYLAQYIDRAFEEAQTVRLYNPDAIDYNIRDDAFRDERFTKEFEALGLLRYDLVPPPLPGRSQRGTVQAQPTIKHFRQMSFYVKGQRIVRIVESIDVDGHPRFRRAREGREAQYWTDLHRSVKAGRSLEPIRERFMSYDITDSGGDVNVTLPTAEAVVGSVEGLFVPNEADAAAPPGGAEGDPAPAPVEGAPGVSPADGTAPPPELDPPPGP